MKTWVFIILGILAVLFFIRFLLGGSEDDWIKDSSGVWIKHGNPAKIPAKVLEQQDAISCALNLYDEKKQEINFSSQCLGTCGKFSVDIVHVPRDSLDNLPENQCTDFQEGRTTSFIELDKNGEIVRIA